MKTILGALAALMLGAGSANAADVFYVTNTTNPILDAVLCPGQACMDGNGYATSISGGADLFGSTGLLPNTTFDIAKASTKEVLTFFWAYASGSAIDSAGYMLDGVEHQLSPSFGSKTNGQFTLTLNAGDTYGFYVVSSGGGPGSIAFSTDGAPGSIGGGGISAAPEPGEWALMLLGLGALGALGARKKRAAAQA